jgi:hypothetical protein
MSDTHKERNAVAKQVSCIESERGVVAICAVNPDAINELVNSAFNSKSIHDEKLRTVFDAMVRIHKRSVTVDAISLIRELKDMECFDEIGGAKAVNDIFDNVIPRANLESCKERIEDWAKRRNISPDIEKLRDELFDRTNNIDLIGVRLAKVAETIRKTSSKRREWIRTHTPCECRDWNPPDNCRLVGNHHIDRGGFAVLAGHGGLGKSRAVSGLAVAGVTSESWFDLQIHSRFKTLIIQAENGPFRLKEEFTEILSGLTPEQQQAFNDSVRISEPPENGMAFSNPQFQAYLLDLIEEFKPGLIVIDPWNRVVKGDGQKDYSDGLDAIRACLPGGDDSPAVLIIAHTRKPDGKNQKHGSELAHEVSGSSLLKNQARCVMVMRRASSDMEDDRIVFETVKINDGIPGKPTAWHRRNGLFVPCADFDWNEFYDSDGPPKGRPSKFDPGDLKALLPASGLSKKEFQRLAEDELGISRAHFYRLFKEHEGALWYDSKAFDKVQPIIQKASVSH